MILSYFVVVAYLNPEESKIVYMDFEAIRIFAQINIGHYVAHFLVNLIFIFVTNPSNIHKCQIYVCQYILEAVGIIIGFIGVWTIWLDQALLNDIQEREKTRPVLKVVNIMIILRNVQVLFLIFLILKSAISNLERER